MVEVAPVHVIVVPEQLTRVAMKLAPEEPAPGISTSFPAAKVEQDATVVLVEPEPMLAAVVVVPPFGEALYGASVTQMLVVELAAQVDGLEAPPQTPLAAVQGREYAAPASEIAAFPEESTAYTAVVAPPTVGAWPAL